MKKYIFQLFNQYLFLETLKSGMFENSVIAYEIMNMWHLSTGLFGLCRWHVARALIFEIRKIELLDAFNIFYVKDSIFQPREN